jgi:two-component system cell cycle sensor histidine kinase/response regulator CckA
MPAIEADATQIRQVIMNLVINASEAIGDKSGVINLGTGVQSLDREFLTRSGMVASQDAPDGSYVFLEVADTGSGMSPETRARIFDPFFTTKFAGRGLGLAAVLGIVRGHKGALRIDSEPGRGTTFRIFFPVAAGDAEADAVSHNHNITWHGHGRVLVVDDEETVRSTAALMLRKLGFEVSLVGDGREAVEVFRMDPSQFVLVLMDLTMPHLDGVQAFAMLRQIRSDVGVVLMSGFNEQEATSRFTGKGLANFIQKPFQFEDLSKAVQGVLAVSP